MIELNKRTYGKTKNISISELKNIFSGINYIDTALLFGSRSTNQYTDKSDYDFAVIFNSTINASWGNKSKLLNGLCDQLKLAEYDIDIVDMNDANSLIITNSKESYTILKGEKSEIQRILN